MFSLLSAVLWLGNIQYRRKTADSVEVVPGPALTTAASLLRVPEMKLVQALCKRKITAGGRDRSRMDYGHVALAPTYQQCCASCGLHMATGGGVLPGLAVTVNVSFLRLCLLG